MHSNYSSVKPASTILTGFPGQARSINPYMPPQSPAPFGGNIPGNRNSHMSGLTRYTDYPPMGTHSRQMSMGNLSQFQESPLNASRHSMGLVPSTENLLGGVSRQMSHSPVGGFNSRPASTAFDFRSGNTGPDELAITEAIRSCLAEVDLDSVTKKQG